jgi:hypothetical protein
VSGWPGQKPLETGPLEPEPEPLGPSAMQYIYIHIYIYINIYIYIYVVDAKELRVPGAWARVLAPRPRAWGFRQCNKPGLGFLKPCRLSPSLWSPRHSLTLSLCLYHSDVVGRSVGSDSQSVSQFLVVSGGWWLFRGCFWLWLCWWLFRCCFWLFLVVGGC